MDPEGRDPVTLPEISDPDDSAVESPPFGFEPDESPPDTAVGILTTPLWWADESTTGGGFLGSASTKPSAAKGSGTEPDLVAPPAPAAFDWSFEDVEEVKARRGYTRWIFGGAAALVAVVVIMASLALDRGKRESAPPGEASTSYPMAPPTPSEAHEPRELTLRDFEGRIYATWQPPGQADHVVGYMAVAQSRQGAVLDHRLLPAGERSAVFTSPPMTRDSCIVVASLIRGSTGVTPVRDEPACL